MEELLKALNGTTIGIILIVIVVLAEYVRLYFTTNIDLLFMNKKEEQKRFLARFMVLCCLLVAINFMLSLYKSFVLIESVVVLATIICNPIVIGGKKVVDWLLGKISFKSQKMKIFCTGCGKYINWEKIRGYFFLMPILMSGPIVSYLIGNINNYDSNLIVVVVSVVETLIIFIQGDGFVSQESKIMINSRDNKLTLYVYKKANDDYLLCGDASKMENAKEISTIEIKELYSKEYFLCIKN